MIEQQVADRFRDAVAGEPPLGFDPDAVIDREIKRTRRRRVVWAVACATMVEAVVVWALSGGPGGDGGDGQLQAASPGAPAPGPPAVGVEIRTYEKLLTLESPVDMRGTEVQVRVNDLQVRNPDGDRGTVQLKLADRVVFEIALENFRDYDMHFDEEVVAEPGVPITLAVNCTASVRDCRGVSLTYSGYSVMHER